MGPRNRKAPRKVEKISRVDRELIEKGLPPTWEQPPLTDDREDHANDSRLLADKPPHY